MPRSLIKTTVLATWDICLQNRRVAPGQSLLSSLLPAQSDISPRDMRSKKSSALCVNKQRPQQRSRGMICSLCSRKENKEGMHHPLWHFMGCMYFPLFMPLCSSHGVAHPTWERRLPGSADSREKQTEPMAPESVAQALD